MEGIRLPEDFMLGTATAAVQIEGGDTNNSWYRWCEQGRIKDGSHCITAADHYNRIDEDIALMKELGCSVYRMGIEWSRIEVEEGRFNMEAIAHYRDELQKLIAAGIRPMITLHHFSNPLWFEDSGSWLNKKAIQRFCSYTEIAVRSFGDLVSDWITINEPNVYCAFSFLQGQWPPGHCNLSKYFKAASIMVKAHIAAYPMIHAIRKDMGLENTLVGTAHHLRVFDPASAASGDRLAAALYRRAFQDMFVHSMTCGSSCFPLFTGTPKGKYADFLGINYYSRDIMRFSWNPAAGFGKQQIKEGSEYNDLGWEIYPKGLARLCRSYYKRYKLPVFITENGIADAQDTKRTAFIHEHLKQLVSLIKEGVDIQRYYHWSLIDNFEWIEGNTPRFGLVEVDYRTQKRTIRESGIYFASVCKTKKL